MGQGGGLGPDNAYTWKNMIGGELRMRQKKIQKSERTEQGIYVTALPLSESPVDATPPQLQNSTNTRQCQGKILRFSVSVWLWGCWVLSREEKWRPQNNELNQVPLFLLRFYIQLCHGCCKVEVFCPFGDGLQHAKTMKSSILLLLLNLLYLLFFSLYFELFRSFCSYLCWYSPPIIICSGKIM